jgi:outer membrane beta-barrel protein
MGALAIWSPFYGKVNTFNRIFYFDWSFGLGIASLDTESNINTVAVRNAPNRYDSASYTALAYKTNFKFHISRNKNISLELRNFNYKAPGPINPKKDEVRSNWDVLIGFGVKF